MKKKGAAQKGTKMNDMEKRDREQLWAQYVALRGSELGECREEAARRACTIRVTSSSVIAMEC